MTSQVDINAGFRPALFFWTFSDHFLKLEEILLEDKEALFFDSPHNLLVLIKDEIFKSLDGFLAPVIALELSNQKSNLLGSSPTERYQNFFINENTWTQRAKCIPKKYSTLFGVVGQVCENYLSALSLFLQRYKKDYTVICTYFQEQVKLNKIDFSLSDRHNNAKTVIKLTFDNGKRLIYKPKNLDTDLVLSKFANILELPEPYRIKVADIIYKESQYGWIEYIEKSEALSKDELSSFYKNSGAVLATLDILNFLDGHHENFICSNSKLVPIDSETIFTNLSYFEGKLGSFYDLTMTGILQELEEGQRYISALQTQSKLCYFPVQPHVINDLSDEMQVRYKLIEENPLLLAFPTNEKLDVGYYTDDVIDGAKRVYKRVAEQKEVFKDFIREYSYIQTRQIVRPTLYYQYTFTKMIHPLQDCFYDEFLEEYLDNLSSSIVEYEKTSLKRCDVPLFYSSLNSCSLKGSNDKEIIPEYFSKTALYWVERKIDDCDRESFIHGRMKEIRRLMSQPS